MRLGFLLPLTVCSAYVLTLLVVSILVVLERIVPGMPHNGVFGVGLAIVGFPLAAFHLIAIAFRNPTAAAVESFLFFAFFLMWLGPIVALWPGLPYGPGAFHEPLWGIRISVTVLNLLSALTMAAFSERCKPVVVDRPQIHDNTVAEVVLRIAGKKETRPCIRPLRRMGGFVLVVSLLFYLIGDDAERRRALLGLIASVILIADSYLIAGWTYRNQS